MSLLTQRTTGKTILALLLATSVALGGCAGRKPVYQAPQDATTEQTPQENATSEAAPADRTDATAADAPEPATAEQGTKGEGQRNDAEALRAALSISEDFRPSFVHGEKPSSCQRYIMLHDTEGTGDAASVIDYWDGEGAGVAAHFIVNKDGSIVQCVPLDAIAHHAGFGDIGHNELFGVEDESRDDKVGTVPIGSDYPDYGMNSYSIGIEMVHASDFETSYPEEQLDAVDALIAYIDAYYGFESPIIDHKAWRLSNSDTSEAFAPYLASYQTCRRHVED